MFTELVEEIGTVLAPVAGSERDNILIIGCRKVLEDAHIGDSITVNGTCLTITDFSSDRFTVGVSPETLRRTNLGLLHPGSPVNLERSVAAGGRMGGHYVQGHVDGTGRITAVVPDGESLRITIEPPVRLMPYLVEKGYAAIDGVSLTVAERTPATITIAVIAHTQGAVIMGRQGPGEVVNIEVDILAKYVEQLIGGHGNAARNS